MIKKDKVLHLIAGATIALLGSIVAGWILGLLLSILAGGLKECWDSKGHGCVELADFLWTVVGGALGVSIWNIILHLI